MSQVRKEDRKGGKLEVLTEAKKLSVYTIQITSNEKVFDPKYKSKLTERVGKSTQARAIPIT
jgi:hypothetical protein